MLQPTRIPPSPRANLPCRYTCLCLLAFLVQQCYSFKFSPAEVTALVFSEAFGSQTRVVAMILNQVSFISIIMSQPSHSVNEVTSIWG